MSLSELLKLYNIEKYEGYITAINTRPINFDVDIFDIDDSKTAEEILSSTSHDTLFTKNEFVNKIVYIYAYKHQKDQNSENFYLIGNLDSGQYFLYYYHFRTNFHDLDCFNFEILYSKDINTILTHEDIPQDLIMLKPSDKL